jgi:hypothetical protein
VTYRKILFFALTNWSLYLSLAANPDLVEPFSETTALLDQCKSVPKIMPSVQLAEQTFDKDLKTVTLDVLTVLDKVSPPFKTLAEAGSADDADFDEDVKVSGPLFFSRNFLTVDDWEDDAENADAQLFSIAPEDDEPNAYMPVSESGEPRAKSFPLHVFSKLMGKFSNKEPKLKVRFYVLECNLDPIVFQHEQTTIQAFKQKSVCVNFSEDQRINVPAFLVSKDETKPLLECCVYLRRGKKMYGVKDANILDTESLGKGYLNIVVTNLKEKPILDVHYKNSLTKAISYGTKQTKRAKKKIAAIRKKREEAEQALAGSAKALRMNRYQRKQARKAIL